MIPIFVFASGFLFQVTLAKREYTTLELIRKKGKRLVKTYFVYGLLWLVPTYTLLDIPSYGRLENTSLRDGYKAMLLGKFSDVSWFLLILFWITLLFILIRKYTQKDKLVIGLVLTLGLTILCKYGLSNVDYYKLSQIYPFIPIYFTGIVFYHELEKFAKMKNIYLLLISITGLLTCLLVCQHSNEFFDYMIQLVSPFFLSLLTIFICRQKKINNKFYDWLIKNNLYIYLLQAPGLYIGYDCLYPIVGQNALLCVSLCIVFTILQDFLLVYLLNIILNYLAKKKRFISLR